MTTIGIFGPANDQEVKSLKMRLKNRGVEALVIDLATFPEKLSISITADDIIIDGISIYTIQSAYLRNRGINLPYFARYDSKFYPDSKKKWHTMHSGFISYIHTEIKCQKIRNSVLQAFSEHRPLINPIANNDLHRLKIYLFWYLEKKGIPVPKFMVGTASNRLKNFALDSNGYSKEKTGGNRSRNRSEKPNWHLKEHLKGYANRFSNEVVTKPLAGIYKTYLWDKTVWRDHKWGMRGAFYQSYIKGDTIRVYLLDGEVIAAAIILHEGTIDSSMSQKGIKVIELSQKASEIARQTAKTLGLAFCGLDLMRDDATDDYYVIDCNISPMFVNFAHQSSIDIPAKIANYLIECTQNKKRKEHRALSLLHEAKDILSKDPDIKKMIKG